MSIYSVNRTGSMALAQVVANESYTSEDFGRIMYETQVNDMAFFEAVLACDFNEIKGLCEGTILESEVAALNESSQKGIISELCERLKKFWAKIKAAINDAIDKLVANTIDNKNNFIKRFDNTAGKKVGTWNGKIEKVRVFNHKDKVFEIENDKTVEFLSQDTADSKLTQYSTAELAGQLLNSNLGGSVTSISPKEFTTQALRNCSSEVDLTKDNIGEFKTAISYGKDYIVTLKKTRRDAEESVNGVIKSLNKYSKSLDKDDPNKSNINNTNKVVSAYEMYINVVIKTAITSVRMDMSSRMAAMRKVMVDINKNKNYSKVILNSAILDDEERIEGSMNVGLDAETKSMVDEIVDSVD